MYIQGATVEDQNPSHWKVTGSSTVATLSVLSHNSILSPPACHYTFIPTGKFRRAVKNIIISGKLLFSKFCARSKWRNLKLGHHMGVYSDNGL
jgi:hypothetical protein